MNSQVFPFVLPTRPCSYNYYQPPLPPAVQTYYQYQSPCYFYYNDNNNDLALQFSNLSVLNDQVMREEPPPPTSSSTNNNILVPQLVVEDSLQLRGKRAAVSSSMKFDESKLDVEIRTTVMIKNIPNKLSRDMLMTVLDQHCAQENYKAAMESSPLSAYDFIYLPMDFVNESNLGYAFVNFTTAIVGWRLHCSMHHRHWAIFSSKKTAHICYARIQGKEALLENFLVCEDDNYLPAVFSPPRDGVTYLTKPAPVGRRIYFGR